MKKMIGITLFFITVLVVVSILQVNKNNSTIEQKEKMSANLEVYENIVIGETKGIESLSNNELAILYEDSTPLPWSTELDFTKYHVLDSASATDDIDTKINLILNKEVECKKNNNQHFYYQIVTEDEDVFLIPKLEDCNYIANEDSIIFNNTTADCVEAIFRLRMYSKTQHNGFKILDYSIIDNQVSVLTTYYTANILNDELIVSKITETVSKGDGSLSKEIINIANIRNK